MDSVSVCNIDSNCTADVNNGRPDVNAVKLAGNLGQGSTRESMVCDEVAGNSELYKGLGVDNLYDHKTPILANGDRIINKEMPNLKGDSKLHGNKEIQTGKLEELVGESDDSVLSPEPSSPTEIEFSGDGINLFVEVFGPLDGLSEGNDNSSVKEEVEECSLENNENIKRLIFNNERENKVDEQDCTFDVGDLVWAKTRTPIWWPGIITDPSSDETKSEKKGAYLVKCFGPSTLVWRNNSDLKPFIEYYEQLSGQNTSRSFCGSVEKALFEVGQRVKSKMTCPCFSKESFNPKSTNGKTDDDVLSLSGFNPTSFLTGIQNFASLACSPGKIEFIVAKNRLSSFYRSTGHRELSMEVLCARDGLLCEVKVEGREKSSRAKKKRNPSDYDDLASADKVSSSKGSESRERKRSKFLSYPFEDLKHGSSSMKKKSKKSMQVRHVVSKADDINAPSNELLAELRSAVCDPFYLEGSKYSDSLKRFYYSFRSYAFLDADIGDKEARAKQVTKSERNHPNNSCKETKAVKKKTKVLKQESENSSSNLDSVKKSPKMDNPEACKEAKAPKKKTKVPKQESEKSSSNLDFVHTLPEVNNLEACKETKALEITTKALKQESENSSSILDPVSKLPNIDNPEAKGSSVLHTSAEKVELWVTSAGLELKSSLGLGTNVNNHNGSCMISFLQPSPDKNNNEPNHPLSGLPDLNKNSPFPDEQVPLSEHSRISKIGLDRSSFSSSTPSKEAVGPTPSPNIQQFTNGVMSTWPGLFAVQPPPPKMERFFSPQTEFDKGKAEEINKASRFPNGVENLPGANPPPVQTTAAPGGTNVSSSDGKQPQKRARKEDPGGSLVLKFEPGFPLPSPETLSAKFSRYGLVKKSEIRALDETSVEIPYVRTPDLCFAHRSLESSEHPFGKALVGFELNCPHLKLEKKPRKSPVLTVGPMTKMPVWRALEMPRMPARPVEVAHRVPAGPAAGAPPDIAFMKKNVEMMKSTLEKMGDEIQPDVRAKLENEIRAFLDKIANVTGSSSST
ncbi:Tudor/PWWP/MBT superfamily protein [Striga hermonthica]|uniref:Tudor/PWWP/MBT superfamily protein n=1 Tax=Striga hermonthica TaxID=68872 RepID=A0A9N7RC07_STRHE|nr:Tudor/PWWP/MBT superfamily protein [Striga hermonthica]